MIYNIYRSIELFYENSVYTFTIDILSVKESKHRVFKKICSDIESSQFSKGVLL